MIPPLSFFMYTSNYNWMWVVNIVKKFYVAVIIATIGILSLITFKQNLFSFDKLPYDSEQQGLDEQIIIHFSHVVAENTPKGMAAAKFAKLVYEKTDGQVIVQVYPNGILYKDDNELEALQNNEIQMIAPTFSKLSQLHKEWLVLDLPFLFESEEQLYTTLNGDVQQMLLQTLEPHNLKGLQFWHNGFKQIATNDKAIQTLEDFSQLQIRIMKSELLQKQFSTLGAKPIQTTFDDVFDKLEDRFINSQDNTLSNLYSKGFHTYEKHITLSNHGILGYAVLMNDDFWESLSPAHQKAIEEALAEMDRWQFEQAVSLNKQALQTLQSIEGTTIYTLDEETKSEWKEKMQPFYDRYENNAFYKVLTDKTLNNN